MLSLVKSSLLLPFAEQPLASAFALGKMRPGSPGDDCTMPFLLKNKQPAACEKYSSVVLSAVKSAASRSKVSNCMDYSRTGNYDDPHARDTRRQVLPVWMLYLSQVQDS